MNIAAFLMSYNINLGPVATDNTILKNFTSSFCRNLNIGHVNAQSLCPSTSNSKLEEFKNIFDDCGLDILGISETWFKPNIYSSLLDLVNYNLIRNDRCSLRVGGVCLYILRNLRHRVIFRGMQYGVCESLFVEIFGVESSFILGIVYLPTGAIDVFEDMHSDIFDKFSNIVVMGDFNYNLFDANKSNNFRSLVNRCGLHYIHNSLPTHINHPTKTTSLLDLFLTSQPSYVAHKSQIQYPFFSSNHSLILLSLHFKCQPGEEWIEFKDYNKFKIDDYLEVVNEFDLRLIYDVHDIDCKLSILNNLINLLHSYVPTARIKANSNHQSWMNSQDIIQARIERDRAYSVFLRNPIDENWKTYKRLRNRTKGIIRKVRFQFGKSYFANVNGSQMWKKVRRLGCIGRENIEIDVNEVETLANNFLSNMCPSDNLSFDFDSFVDDADSFSFHPITEYELLSSLNSIKSNSLGYDSIPIKFIKQIFPAISSSLMHILNTVLTVSSFPDAWKLGKIIPIPKDCHNSIGSFRPISILPSVSKILENVMKEQILEHYRQISFFSPFQFAFRKNHNTTSALLSITDSIRRHLNVHPSCLLVSLDVTKAFDRVNHRILLEKLRDHCKFSKTACRLIYSYLSDRRQYVSSNNIKSSIGFVTSGVPQGSILGPILFLSYVNDIIAALESRICEPYVFADDIFLLFKSYDSDLEINSHLHHVSNLLSLNKLDINPLKTKAMLLHTRRHGSSCPNIKIGSTLIQTVESMKCLGINVDSKLDFSDHIDDISRKVCLILRRLYSLKEYTPIAVRKQLAHSLLMSLVNYGIEVYSGTWGYNLNIIERFVRRIVRYVYQIRVYDHVRTLEATEDFLGCTFPNFVKQRIVLHFYKLVKYQQPEILVTQFSFINSARNTQIDVPLVNNAFFEHSFFVRVYRVWNPLPTPLRRFSFSYFTFKKKLKSFVNSGHNL